jgi:hypothetical protein
MQDQDVPPEAGGEADGGVVAGHPTPAVANPDEIDNNNNTTESTARPWTIATARR